MDSICFCTFFQVRFAPSRAKSFFPKSCGFSRESLIVTGGVIFTCVLNWDAEEIMG